MKPLTGDKIEQLINTINLRMPQCQMLFLARTSVRMCFRRCVPPRRRGEGEEEHQAERVARDCITLRSKKISKSVTLCLAVSLHFCITTSLISISPKCLTEPQDLYTETVQLSNLSPFSFSNVTTSTTLQLKYLPLFFCIGALGLHVKYC